MRFCSRIFTFFLLIFLVSCGTIRNEYWIEADGSGRMELAIDMSEGMDMIKMFMEMAPDSVKEKSPHPIKLALSDPNGVLDTLLSSQNMDRDGSDMKRRDSLQLLLENKNLSVIEKKKIQSKIMMMDSTKVRMFVDNKNGVMKMTVYQPFDDINSLASMGESIGMLSPDGQSTPNMDKQPDPLSNITYGLTKKTFTFNLGEKGPSEEDDMKTVEEMKQMGMDLNFDMIYHLPGKIKKVKGEGISIKDNAAVINLSMEDIMSNEKDFGDYYVKFKPYKKKKK